MIQACWRNVGSRRRNVKGNVESDEQGRNVPKGHTQATGIIQLLNKEEDMMKEAKPFVSDPKVMSMHKELSVKSRVRGDSCVLHRVARYIPEERCLGQHCRL